MVCCGSSSSVIPVLISPLDFISASWYFAGIIVNCPILASFSCCSTFVWAGFLSFLSLSLNLLKSVESSCGHLVPINFSVTFRSLSCSMISSPLTVFPLFTLNLCLFDDPQVFSPTCVFSVFHRSIFQ